RRSCSAVARRSREQLLPRVLARNLLQLLERLAFLLRQLLGHGHAQPREQIASTLATELRRAVAAHAQQLAVLRAGLHLQRPALAAGPLAARARLLDHGAVAATARARLRECEQPLAL